MPVDAEHSPEWWCTRATLALLDRDVATNRMASALHENIMKQSDLHVKRGQVFTPLVEGSLSSSALSKECASVFGSEIEVSRDRSFRKRSAAEEWYRPGPNGLIHGDTGEEGGSGRELLHLRVPHQPG